LLKEFYTLTPWHTEKDTTNFTAFSYYDPDKEEGIVLAFCQETYQKERLHVMLPFAERGERFSVVDEDTKEEHTVQGQIDLYFDAQRTAKLLWIKKI
jgi:hypothetical protein